MELEWLDNEITQSQAERLAKEKDMILKKYEGEYILFGDENDRDWET